VIIACEHINNVFIQHDLFCCKDINSGEKK